MALGAGLVALSTKLPSKTSGQARQVRNGYGSFHERLRHYVREKKHRKDTLLHAKLKT
jgi:hypothetical protein